MADDPAVTETSTEPTVEYRPLSPGQFARSGALVKQIGLTITNQEHEHWNELLTIWGHK